MGNAVGLNTAGSADSAIASSSIFHNMKSYTFSVGNGLDCNQVYNDIGPNCGMCRVKFSGTIGPNPSSSVANIGANIILKSSSSQIETPYSGEKNGGFYFYLISATTSTLNINRYGETLGFNMDMNSNDTYLYNLQIHSVMVGSTNSNYYVTLTKQNPYLVIGASSTAINEYLNLTATIYFWW